MKNEKKFIFYSLPVSLVVLLYFYTKKNTNNSLEFYMSESEILQTHSNQAIIPTKQLLAYLNMRELNFGQNVFINFDYEHARNNAMIFTKLKETFPKVEMKYYNFYAEKCNNEKPFEIIKSLGLRTLKDLNNVSYCFINGTKIKVVFKGENNFESLKLFVKGMKKVGDYDLLNKILLEHNQETVHFLIPSNDSLMYSVIERFFLNNSYFFSNLTFNFIEITDKLRNQLKLNPDEFAICFKRLKEHKVTEIPDLIEYKATNELTVDKENSVKRNFQIDFLIGKLNFLKTDNLVRIAVSKGKNEDEFKNLYINPSDTSIKTVKIKEELIDEGFDLFSNFLEYIIDPLSFKENEKSSKLPDLAKVFHRKIYESNNYDLGTYYKKQFFKEKKKILFVYVNFELINELKIDENINIYSQTKDIISNTLKKLDSDLLKDLRIIITGENRFNHIFQIIPSEKEFLSIRYIDFGQVSKFNNDSYQILKLEDNLKFSDEESNTIFTLKYKYLANTLNETEILNFIQKSLENKNKPYLESHSIEGIDYSDFTQINTISSSNFKDRIFNQKGKKVLLVIDEFSIGCETAKALISKFIRKNPEILAAYYEYDRMNENPIFKKNKRVPYLYIFDSGKLIGEIDLYREIEECKQDNVFSLLSKMLS